MRGGLRRLRRALRSGAAGFARGSDGNIAMMTAFMTVPIVLMFTVAIDTAELYRAKQNFQQAADAAVLVAAKIYSDGGGKTKAEAAGKKAFADNLANLKLSEGQAAFTFPSDCSTGNITVAVSGYHPLFFPGVHGVTGGETEGVDNLGVNAAASCPTTTFEVALVVDTSGSMGWSPAGGGERKIVTLRTAAKGLIDDLFAIGPTIPRPDPVKFAIIPFSPMVAVDYENDVNTGVPSNMHWSRSYEDRQGKSSIHHKDFDWTWDTARKPTQRGGGWKNTVNDTWLTRYTLFDDLNVKWKGCMQARPYPEGVTDEPPTASQPNTLFVPAFGPDEPDRMNGWDAYKDADGNDARPHCTEWRKANKKGVRYCRTWSDGETGRTNRAAFPEKPTYNQRPYYNNGEYQTAQTVRAGRTIQGEVAFRNSYIKDATNMPSDNMCRGNAQHDDCTGKRDQPLRQGWTFKYKNAVWWDGDPNRESAAGARKSSGGPNFNCKARPLMPLSTNQEALKDYMDLLNPTGATNVPAGAIWGWRTLSSNPPFVGRPESQLDNRKILILMTDGQNTYYPGGIYDYNKTEYGGYGYGRHHDGKNDENNGDGYMYDGYKGVANPGHSFNTRTSAMDARLAKICENAKKAKVTVYTVAFDVAAGSSIKQTLLECASPTDSDSGIGVKDGDGQRKLYFDATSSSKLLDAFKDIAKSLQKLKLVQ